MNPIFLAIIIVISSLILIYLIMAYIIFMNVFRRKKCVELVDLDLDKTQYKECKNVVLENSKKIRMVNYDKITFKGMNNIIINARYYNNNSKKTIICVHGYHATVENNFMVSFNFLYEKGFNVFMIESRASNSSGGKYITFGDKERFDLAIAVKEVVNNYHPEEITLYGVSMGSSIIIDYLGQKIDPHVKNAILDCAYSNTKGIIEYQMISRFRKYNPLRLVIKSMMPLLALYAKMHGFSININPINEIMKNENVRTLYYYGDNDKFIPKYMWLECYNADNTYYKKIFHTNAMHAMSCYQEFDKVKKELIDFLKIR